MKFNSKPLCFIKRSLQVATYCFGFLYCTSVFGALLNPINTSLPHVNSTLNTLQDTFVIRGAVTDENGNPLPGATVMITNVDPSTEEFDSFIRGTQSDFDGNFSIEVALNNYLVVRYVGYDDFQVQITSQQTTYDIGLLPTQDTLDEVVLIGYGSTERSKVGSAISSVKASTIERNARGLINIDNILGGQIKGVQMSVSTGAVNAPSHVNIRGITSSFGGSRNQPLYVIDNIPFNTDPSVPRNTSINGGNPLLSISPDDIEEISVLKDAAATAIYGSRGANGVIIINTKRGGKNSKLNVQLKVETTSSAPAKLPNMLDAEGFKQLHTMMAKNTIEAYKNKTASTSAYRLATLIMDPNTMTIRDTWHETAYNEELPVFGSANTKWSDEVYRQNALAKRISLSVRGGDSKTRYSASLTNDSREQLLKSNDFKRNSARLTLDTDVNPWINLGGTINYSMNEEKKGGQYSPNFNTPVSEVLLARPDYPVYATDGSLQRFTSSITGSSTPGVGRSSGRAPNPLALLTKNKNRLNASNFIGNVYAEFYVLKNLKFRSDLNVASFRSESLNFSPKISITKYTFRNHENRIESSWVNRDNISLNHSLSYNTLINEKHRINTLLGYSENRIGYENKVIYANNTPDDDVFQNIGSGVFSHMREGKFDSGINSFLGRVQYNYDEKYSATLNYRSDRSSKFGPNNQWAHFPSMALNWNMKKERFLEDISNLNQLSFRVSYGQTGSANVNDFLYLQYFLLDPVRFTYNGTRAIIPAPVFPNESIKWEKTTEGNIGVDFRAFDNRLYGSLDVYSKYTKDVLTPTPIYYASGTTNFTSNFSEISNKGLEIELGVDIIRKEDFDWFFSVNWATNKNRLEKIDESGLHAVFKRAHQVGKPVGLITGYIVEGILQTQEEVDALNEAARAKGFPYYRRSTTGPGDYKYKDVNGDGRVAGFEDYAVLGDIHPDYFGGFSTSIRYKRLNLFTSFQYSVGAKRHLKNFNSLYSYNANAGGYSGLNNMATSALTDSWTPERKDATYPRLIYNNTANNVVSSANVFDTSYLRCKSIGVTYDFPQEIVRRIPAISDVSVYGVATNVFTITKYPGLDPESSRSVGGYSSDNIRVGSGIIGNREVDSSTYPFQKGFTFGLKASFK